MKKTKIKRRVKRGIKRIRNTGLLIASFLRRPENLRYVPPWVGSLFSTEQHFSAHMPYLPYCVIGYLEKRLHPQTVAFEYGGGGSTLWLAKRVGSLTTVEHDACWFNSIQEEMRKAPDVNCTLLLREPQYESASPSPSPGDSINYGSSMCPGSFEEYAKAIDPFPDSSFDLVLVDGRSRAACLVHAAPKVRPGGLLVLDDSHREHYRPGMKTLRPWMRKDFWGIRPFRSKPGCCTCWTRPCPVGELTEGPMQSVEWTLGQLPV